MKNTLTSNFAKLFRRATLFSIFIFGMMSVATANTRIAETTYLQLKAKNKTIKNILSEIESKTDFVFFYFDEDVELNEQISIEVKNEPIDKILGQVFKDTDYTYKISDRQVYITKEQKEVKTIADNKRKITGVIVDDTNEPVIGAAILIEGTTRGTTTDIDGKFSLDVEIGNKLSINYVGYKKTTVTVDNNSSYTIKLLQDQQLLDEVVVVGYGVQKRVNLSGSLEVVTAEQLANKPVTSLAAAMAGQAAGLTVTQSNAQPGAKQGEITIRGKGSWDNSTPLVLVDGLPSSMDNVIPSQIESISVLKDASSAAIYGSRAANGVILITTKQGKAGKTKIVYDGNVGIQRATRRPQMASNWQYAELENRYLNNNQHSADKIQRMKDGLGDPDANEANTDWYKELLRNGVQHMHQASISGGANNVIYHATLGYTNQEGVIPNTNYERYNTRLNTTATLTDWMKLGLNMSYLTGKQKFQAGGGANEVFRRAGRGKPFKPVQYSDGTWSYDTAAGNPIYRAEGGYGIERMNEDITTVQITPEFNILEGLVVKGMLGYESSIKTMRKYEPDVFYGAFEKGGQGAIQEIPEKDRKQTNKWEKWENLTSNITVNYMKSLGQHNFTLLGGGSLETARYLKTQASRKGFSNNSLSEIDAGDKAQAEAEGYSTYNGLASIFGRINYDYAGRYLFEANFRRDGSSKFARGHRWGTFPSFSGAWRVSEESFFEPLKDHVQNLKLRASWGRLGNNRIGDFKYITRIGTYEARSYGYDDKIAAGFKELEMGNPDITWETSESLNFGLDISVLNQRLNASFDWFTRDTKDLLMVLNAPDILGIKAPQVNAGKIRNRGWEITVNWRDKIGSDFTYHVGVNLSDVKNEIRNMAGQKSPSSDLKSKIVGHPLDALYGFKTHGIADTPEKVKQHEKLMKTYRSEWQLGDLIIEDTNGDGKIDESDKQIIGDPTPRYTFGITLGAEYKGFDLSMFFQGVGKADGYIINEGIQPMGTNGARVEHYTDSFDPNNPTTGKYFPRIAQNTNYNYVNMSHWVQNAAYLRMKNFQLGYTFKVAKIERIRTYFSAENLFTITNFKTWDPETAVGAAVNYPNVSTYSFGVNVTF